MRYHLFTEFFVFLPVRRFRNIIYEFSKYLLSTYIVPGTVLDAGCVAVNTTQSMPLQRWGCRRAKIRPRDDSFPKKTYLGEDERDAASWHVPWPGERPWSFSFWMQKVTTTSLNFTLSAVASLCFFSSGETFRPFLPCLRCCGGLVGAFSQGPVVVSLSPAPQMWRVWCLLLWHGRFICWSSSHICHTDPSFGADQQYFLLITVLPTHSSPSVLPLPNTWCFSWVVTRGVSQTEGEMVYVHPQPGVTESD